jgi:hypothetical protein
VYCTSGVRFLPRLGIETLSRLQFFEPRLSRFAHQLTVRINDLSNTVMSILSMFCVQASVTRYTHGCNMPIPMSTAIIPRPDILLNDLVVMSGRLSDNGVP